MRIFPLLFLATILALPAAAQTLVVRPEVCAAVTEHVADPSVAYKEGVDAAGRMVAPAGLATIRGPLFDEVAIQLSVDLKRRLGIKLDETLFPQGAELGYVTVREGKAYFNGAPLAVGSDAALASLCRGTGLRWQNPPR
jgi:hypothetical protein